jgi:hypothetical protein
VGVHYGIYTRSYNVSNISYVNSLPLPFSFIPPPPIPGVVSISKDFVFTYVCTYFLNHIHPPTPFPITFPLSLVPALPSGQDFFHLLSSGRANASPSLKKTFLPHLFCLDPSMPERKNQNLLKTPFAVDNVSSAPNSACHTMGAQYIFMNGFQHGVGAYHVTGTQVQ